MKPTFVIAVALAALGVVLIQSAVGQDIPANAVKVDTVFVELTPFGFRPTQVTHPPGRFFLYVRNKSGNAPRSLRLSHGNGASATAVKQKTLNQNSPHWIDTFELTGGDYALTEDNHPTWTCSITIK